MRERLFGELTNLLEAARGEALDAFRGRFHEAGIEFGTGNQAVSQAEGGGHTKSGDPTKSDASKRPGSSKDEIKLERSEAVAELERRQEHERSEVRRMHDERETRSRQEQFGGAGRGSSSTFDAPHAAGASDAGGASARTPEP